MKLDKLIEDFEKGVEDSALEPTSENIAELIKKVIFKDVRSISTLSQFGELSSGHRNTLEKYARTIATLDDNARKQEAHEERNNEAENAEINLVIEGEVCE